MMQFKRGVFRCLGMVGSVMWLMSSAVQAEDTVLLDSATLAVGTTVGEYLVVKESCPDPARTDCQPTDKLKYVSAVAGRSGKIEFAVNLTDNFEIEANIYGIGQTITLYKADNSSLYIRVTGEVIFNDPRRSNAVWNLGWQNDAIENIKLSANNGVAFLSINSVPFKNGASDLGDTVALDISQPYVKLTIGNINDAMRLFEVKIRGGMGTGTIPSGGGDFESGKQTGIQQCQTDPASCGITVTTTGDFEAGKQAGIQQCQTDPVSCSITVTTNVDPDLCKQAGIQQCLNDPASCGISVTSGGTGGAHATFNPCTGELHIPLVDVPAGFGGVQTYEIYLMQQPLTFTFDLDVNRIIPK